MVQLRRGSGDLMFTEVIHVLKLKIVRASSYFEALGGVTLIYRMPSSQQHVLKGNPHNPAAYSGDRRTRQPGILSLLLAN